MRGSTPAVSSFNASLVESGRRLMIREYLVELNFAVLKTDVLSFAHDLLELVQRDECCVPHVKLVEYGVLAAKNASNNFLRLAQQFELVEGTDFDLLQVGEKQGGLGRPKKDYLLHPDAFEVCLMRAKNTRRYAHFYSLLRKTVAGYDKYQLALEQKLRTDAEAGRVEAEARSRAFQVELEGMRAENRKHFGEVKTELGGVKSELGAVHKELGTMHRKLDAVVGIGEVSFGKLDEVAEHLSGSSRGIASVPEDARRPRTSCCSRSRAWSSTTGSPA